MTKGFSRELADAFAAVDNAAIGISSLSEEEAQNKIFAVMNSLPKNVARKVVRKFQKDHKAQQGTEFFEWGEKLLKAGIEDEEEEFDITLSDGSHKKIHARMEVVSGEEQIYKDIKSFKESGYILQRSTHSALHRLEEAVFDARLLSDDDGMILRIKGFPQNTFVVEHDWAKAFDKAENISEGEFQLPYDLMCFEFRISGRQVCVFINNKTDCSGFVEFGKEWVELHKRIKGMEFHDLYLFLMKQIRAICVALEAEVAETDIVRAPHKLNSQREKSGKLPLYDYHIVKLAHRTRYAPLPDDHVPSERKRQRMHFVRGHWKHYTNHKTWTKWFLKGDPDLGFIDKEYRL